MTTKTLSEVHQRRPRFGRDRRRPRPVRRCPRVEGLHQRRRDHSDRHPAALRHLFNRLLGCLHHCLATEQLYDPTKAFAQVTPTSP